MEDGSRSLKSNDMDKLKVTIIDGGFGNIYSLCSAIKYLGYEPNVTTEFELIINSDRLILPGVGAFGAGMRNLYQKSLKATLDEAVMNQKISFLGICLGMQLLAKTSEEAEGVTGLGWINGDVEKLKSQDKVLPHIGFDNVKGFKDGKNRDFYFVHSYALHSVDESCRTFWSSYGTKFISGISKGNINGVQFHPEKSQSNGLLLLENFLKTGGIY